MISAILFVVFVSVAYLAGSVCSAVIVSNLFNLPDPRTKGSQNPGATNVLRLAGKKYALMVLIGDMLKGFLPVMVAHLLDASPTILGFTCLAAVLGHIYPVFFKFQGGKGVATAIGALFGLNLMLGIIVLGIWLLVANFSRYSSLASIISITLSPIIAIAVTHDPNTLPPLALIMLVILYQHRQNMVRLMDGVEEKIKFNHHDLSDITDQLVKTDTKEQPKAKASLKVKVTKTQKKVSAAAASKVAKTKTVKTAKKEGPAAAPKTTVKKTVKVTKTAKKKSPIKKATSTKAKS